MKKQKQHRTHTCRSTDLAIRWPTGELWLLWDTRRRCDFEKHLRPAFNRELARRIRTGEIPVGTYGYPDDKDAPHTYRPRDGEVVLDPRPATYVQDNPLPQVVRITVTPAARATLARAIEEGVALGHAHAVPGEASDEGLLNAITSAVMSEICRAFDIGDCVVSSPARGTGDGGSSEA